MENTTYAKPEIAQDDGRFHIGFIIRETGTVLEKTFETEYSAWKFVNKLKYSKKCDFVYQYPHFSY